MSLRLIETPTPSRYPSNQALVQPSADILNLFKAERMRYRIRLPDDIVTTLLHKVVGAPTKCGGNHIIMATVGSKHRHRLIGRC